MQGCSRRAGVRYAKGTKACLQVEYPSASSQLWTPVPRMQILQLTTAASADFKRVWSQHWTASSS
jgi:hypothetical protein